MNTKLENSDTVSLTIKKHLVTVKDELIVLIKHPKNCKKPCSDIKSILNYLEAELFVAEGYEVKDKE